MSTQFKNKDKSNENMGKDRVSEPEMTYTRPSIRFFSSFEEMNAADITEMAGFTPLQNFLQATQMILSFYAAELQKPMDKKIHFRK